MKTISEKSIEKIALLTTILGIIFLWQYNENVQLPVLSPLDTEPSQEDREIFLQGVVSSINAKNKVLFLEVEGEIKENVPVILFPEEELFLQEGDYVEITGRLETREGKKEVIASEVVVK